MIIEGVLGQLRAQLIELAGSGRCGEDAGRVVGALDAYVRAHATRVANEFAARNGLPAVPGSTDVDAAALALRQAVNALPELRGAAPTSAIHPRAETPGLTATNGDGVPSRASGAEVPSLEEAQRQLERDFAATPFGAMRLEEFLLHADEFAARARALQDRSGGDPVSQRIIRRLTALVHERDLPRRVFGLSRAHAADRAKVADEARAKRLAATSREDARRAPWKGGLLVGVDGVGPCDEPAATGERQRSGCRWVLR